jgi:hypothetical protein
MKVVQLHALTNYSPMRRAHRGNSTEAQWDVQLRKICPSCVSNRQPRSLVTIPTELPKLFAIRQWK